MNQQQIVELATRYRLEWRLLHTEVMELQGKRHRLYQEGAPAEKIALLDELMYQTDFSAGLRDILSDVQSLPEEMKRLFWDLASDSPSSETG